MTKVLNIRRKAVMAAFWVLCGASHCVQASEAVDPADLSTRIEAGTRAIWPDMKVDVTLEGCRYRQVKDFRVQDERTQDVVEVNLRNIQTNPENMFRNQQLMGDGTGRTWWRYGLVYHWDQDFLARHADEIAELDRAHDRLDRDFDKETSVNLSDQEYEAILQKFSGHVEGMVSDVKAGLYGDVFAKNYRVTTTWRTTGRNVYMSRFLDLNDPDFSYLDFTLDDDVADQIVADLHAYALAHCQP